MFSDHLKTTDPVAYVVGVQRTKSEDVQLVLWSWYIIIIIIIIIIQEIYGVLLMSAAAAAVDRQIMSNSGLMQIEGFGLNKIVSWLYQKSMGVYALILGLSLLSGGSVDKTVHVAAKCALFYKVLALTFCLSMCALEQGHRIKKEDGPTNEDDPTGMFERSPGTKQEILLWGAVNLTSVCLSLVGDLNLALEQYLAISGGTIVNKHRGYSVCSFLQYGFVFPLLTGFSQISLGFLAGGNFVWGAYPKPVKIAFVAIYYPSVLVVVGAIRVIWAFWGLIRFFD